MAIVDPANPGRISSALRCDAKLMMAQDRPAPRSAAEAGFGKYGLADIPHLEHRLFRNPKAGTERLIKAIRKGQRTSHATRPRRRSRPAEVI